MPVAKLGKRTSEKVWALDHIEGMSRVFPVEPGRNVGRDLEPSISEDSDQTPH